MAQVAPAWTGRVRWWLGGTRPMAGAPSDDAGVPAPVWRDPATPLPTHLKHLKLWYMSSEEMTIEQARAKLGDRVIAAMNGQPTTITRYGRPAAMLVPYTEETNVTTYTAAIGLVSNVVAGDFCDVSVIEDKMVAVRDDEAGNEMPVYGPEGDVVMEAVETTVRADDEDVAGKVYEAADDVLSANGWRRTSAWDDAAGDAAYATVERS